MRQEAAQDKEKEKEREEEVKKRKRSKENDNLKTSGERKEEAPPRFNAPPPAEARVDLQNEWVLREGKIVYLVRIPRRGLFYPTGGGCPVD